MVCHADPRHGAITMMKNDLSDAFFTLLLAMVGIPKLGSTSPAKWHGVPVSSFHMGLPMGWTQSPE